MKISQRDEDGKLVLVISGKCTVEHAVRLRDALLAATAQNKPLALDVSGVEDVDLTFLQLLIATTQTVEKHGASLQRLGDVSPALAEAARVSGFDQTPRLKKFFA